MRTSATIECWRAGTEPEVLSAALFDGALVVFQGLAPVKRLVHRARAILQDVFDTDDPPGAESRVGAREFRRMAMGARQVIASDQVVGRHWRDALAAVGYRPASTWFDRIRLRVVPSRTDIDHIDSRTVWDADRRSGRGAPNVDGSAGTEMWQWYQPPLSEGASP